MSNCMWKIVGMQRTGVRFWAVVLMVACTGLDCWADELPKDLVAIGGRWFVGPGENPNYYYKDGDQQTGVYHYHKYPSCVKSPFKDDGKQHSPILGFAFDGFPLHGPYESEGVMAKDLTKSAALDDCSGHIDEVRGYHYYVTPGCVVGLPY